MSSTIDDTAHFKKFIAREAPGEIMRWFARPAPGPVFRAGFVSYLLAIPWLAIALPVFLGMVGALVAEPRRSVPLWEKAAMGFGVVFTFAFVAIGLVMLAAPFRARAKARRTVYAITDKRILAIVDGPSLKVTSIRPERILKVERREKRDGSGSLKIVIGYAKDSDGDTVEHAETLAAIPGVRDAERHVTALMDAAGGRRSD